MSSTAWDTTQESVDADRLTRGIVTAVADDAGVDATDLPPLYNVLDPELLAAYLDLCRQSTDRPDRVAFDFADYRIEVATSGAVEVTPLGADDEGLCAVTEFPDDDTSRLVRYECGGRELVLLTEPDEDNAWIQSDHAVAVEA